MCLNVFCFGPAPFEREIMWFKINLSFSSFLSTYLFISLLIYLMKLKMIGGSSFFLPTHPPRSVEVVQRFRILSGFRSWVIDPEPFQKLVVATTNFSFWGFCGGPWQKWSLMIKFLNTRFQKEPSLWQNSSSECSVSPCSWNISDHLDRSYKCLKMSWEVLFSGVQKWAIPP
jgi:hypothetical protein